MQRRPDQYTTPRSAGNDDTAEAPVRDPAQQAPARRLRDVARAYPLASFAAVVMAGYVLGRMLRR
jgi:hypothetical protein